MPEAPLLHLDDRFLHGKILHGWGGRLGIRRYLLITRAPLAADRLAGFREAAGEAGASLCVYCVGEKPSAEAGAALGEQRADDFWLCESPAAALGLIWEGRKIARLLIVAVRDAEGLSLGEEYCFGRSTIAAMRALRQAGVGLEARPFPDADALDLEPLLSPGDR